MITINTNLSNELLSLIRQSYNSSKLAYDIIKDSDEDSKAGVLMNNSVTKMSIAKSIYTIYNDDLAHHQLDTIFENFMRFEMDFFDNFSQNHSHQSSLISYIDYEEAVHGFGPLNL